MVSGAQSVEGAQFDVFDMQGKVAAQGVLTNGSINVGALAQGNYVLRLTQAGSVRSQKFIKK
jgi:uncharacterized surface anchored protein